ncbi:hypothetical protein ACXPVS_16925 [Pseudomonas sp. Ma2-10]
MSHPTGAGSLPVPIHRAPEGRLRGSSLAIATLQPLQGYFDDVEKVAHA